MSSYKAIYSQDNLEAALKQILWDYIHGNPSLKGTSVETGLSTSIKLPRDINIDNWLEFQQIK